MNIKLSIIAASVALILSGCGSDDSNDSTTTPTLPTTPPAVQVTNKFIDNVVEGMYYTTTSGKSGLTNSAGEYTAMSDDTITFYIGGEKGIKVGAASNRDVPTPFEAAGKYERAINLAILLQSVNTATGNDVLTIPDELRNPSDTTLIAMADLSLDNRTSVEEFITKIVGADSIVDEAEAIAHMNTSFGDMVRGGEGSNPLMQVGTFVRQIQVTQNALQHNMNEKEAFIHADTMMDEDLYNRTRGMSEMTLRIDSADTITIMPGSIDSGISGDKAALYLTCINNDTTWEDESCSDGTILADDHFTLDDGYAYLLRDANEKTIVEESESAEVFMPFRAKTLAELNHYTADAVRNDEATSKIDDSWKRETMSGSYDPITGIYTEIMKDTSLKLGTNAIACDSEGNECTAVRTSEKVFYSYLVDSVDSGYEERYVDFAGTWESSAICDDGQQAVQTTVFDHDSQAISGQECKTTSPGDVGDENPDYLYTTTSDMWWFGQAGRASKATLTELNSTIRYCDQNDYEQGDSCNAENVYYVKWEYQPAGKNWDQGLLIRTKTNRYGEVRDFSIMQKVK